MGASQYGYPQEKYPWGNADMIIKGDKIWVLSMQGTIRALDINTGKTVADPPEKNNNFVAIDTDRKGNIILSRFDRSIVRLDTAALTFKDVYMSPKPIYDVIFDRDNQPFAITDEGITDLSTGKSYIADTSFYANKQIRKWLKPAVVTLDNNDNIWIGMGLGEWAGELYVFNTTEKKFIKTNIGSIKEKGERFSVISLAEVQAITKVGKFMYVSFGFGNGEPQGCITRFNGVNCDSLIVSRDIWPPDTSGEWAVINGKREFVHVVRVSNGDYTGPVVYSPQNHHLYFYYHSEILMGDMQRDISKSDAWNSFKINRQWAPQSNSWGVNVLRAAIAPNGKLYLLTQTDGIGVFDGKAFSLLN